MQLVTFCVDTKLAELIDGSNDSLYHANEDVRPVHFSPSLTIFENFNVLARDDMEEASAN